MTWGIVGVFLGGKTVAEVTPFLLWAGLAVGVRAAATWASDVFASIAATRTKSQLRSRIADAVATLGPGWVERRSSASLATTATHGLDALDSYFAAYLPQLVLTAIATPVFIVVILLNDWVSALAVIITMPVIPVFMVLIGFFTQDVQKKQWTALTVLSGHFLDVIQGLSTLKIFGRERRQVRVIRDVTTEYRTRTMKVLRVSFMSGFVLELGATLAVAIVAVLIGTRLIAGELDLTTGLFVLLITPEAFLPLRQVGANYHAAAEGITAANDVFEILDAARDVSTPQRLRTENPSPSRASLVISDLRVTYPEATQAALDGFSLRASTGTITAISGPSGAGKSTIFAALLGFTPSQGTISIDDGSGTSPWHRGLASWAGQRPSLRDGSIAENLRLGDETTDKRIVSRSLHLASIDIDQNTLLGPDGDGLSGGQAQRVALARAYYRLLRHDLPVLLLDEPTSALDSETERAVIGGWRQLADAGHTVIVITHRESMLAAADHVVRVEQREPAEAVDA